MLPAALAYQASCYTSENRSVLTWNNVSRIHGVFVLDEAEAIHELNLGNLARAMSVEVILNIGLGSYNHGPVSDARSPRMSAPSPASLDSRIRNTANEGTFSASPKSEAARRSYVLMRQVGRNIPLRGRLPR